MAAVPWVLVFCLLFPGCLLQSFPILCIQEASCACQLPLPYNSTASMYISCVQSLIRSLFARLKVHWLHEDLLHCPQYKIYSIWMTAALNQVPMLQSGGCRLVLAIYQGRSSVGQRKSWCIQTTLKHYQNLSPTSLYPHQWMGRRETKIKSGLGFRVKPFIIRV